MSFSYLHPAGIVVCKVVRAEPSTEHALGPSAPECCNDGLFKAVDADWRSKRSYEGGCMFLEVCVSQSTLGLSGFLVRDESSRLR